MNFEGRELKPYAEPVSAAELREKEVYFAVTFVDDDMLIPVMETLVFIGRNLELNDVKEAYFQDIHSYREGVPYDFEADDGNATFYSGPEDELNHIFTYEHALDVLMRCALNRRKVRTDIKEPSRS